jgi:nucleoside-triphosphatase THEP1
MAFQRAKRTASHLRIGITGPTNGGKTFTALRIAVGLVIGGLREEGIEKPSIEQIFNRIALADTERGRGRLYADRNDLPMVTGEYWYTQVEAPYTTDKYISAVTEAATLVGLKGVVIIDSITHAWSGTGGVLEKKEEISKKSGQTSFSAWNDTNKMQNEMVDAILSVPAHTISTMRAKMEYVLEQNDKGKMQPKQVGLAPVQRGDLEYEFDLTLMINKDHTASVIKDMSFLERLTDEYGILPMITEELGLRLYEWVNSGTDPKEFEESERIINVEKIQKLAKDNPELKALYKQTLFPTKPSAELTLKETKEVLREFEDILKLKK